MCAVTQTNMTPYRDGRDRLDKGATARGTAKVIFHRHAAPPGEPANDGEGNLV